MYPELPEEHGLRDHGVTDPHVSDRLHQGVDEQLPGSSSRPLSHREHQHHRPKSGHGEYQDQGGGAGDHGSRVSGSRWAQENPGGHAALPTLRLREDALSGAWKDAKLHSCGF